MSKIKEQYLAHKQMVIQIAPATIANYIAVWFLTFINFGHIWIMSAVIIGDIIGIEINTQIFKKKGFTIKNETTQPIKSEKTI